MTAAGDAPAASVNVMDYAAYDYATDDAQKIVDFGTLPGFLQATLSSEVLLHDRILQRHLAASGWSIREHGYIAGAAMLPYTDGRLDVLFMGDFPSIRTLAKGGFTLVSAISVGQCSVIARERITANELRGMRIGYAPGTALEYSLATVLERVGLTWQDIEPVPFAPGRMERLLRSGSVDAVVELEPGTSSLLSRMQDSRLVASTPMSAHMLVDDRFAARNPEVVTPILAAMVRMGRWLRVDESNLATALRWIRDANIRIDSRSDIEVDSRWLAILRRETVDNGNYPFLPLDTPTMSGIVYQEFEYMKRAGSLPAEADWEHIQERIGMSALPDIVEESSRWQVERFDYASETLYPGTPSHGQPQS